MNRWLALGLLTAVALALVLRLPRLEQRPLHTDEAVHAVKFLGLWERGEYRYDPHEYHGPSLYYSTLPAARLAGAPISTGPIEATLRLVPLIFGIGLILLLPLIADGLGRGATLWAALFTAVSTAFVYYSRYFIHELLLVFFTMLWLGACWRYWRKPCWAWALLAGLAVGLMHATKETFVLNLGAAALAAAGAILFSSRRRELITSFKQRWHWRHALAAVLVAAAISTLLFSSFFSNPSGPPDSIRTYLPWLSRAEGNSPHVHPWNFYLERLFWFQRDNGPVFSEVVIGVLAVVGGVAAFLPSRGQARYHGPTRFLALYSCLLAVLYSALPYKTPWCALGFLHGWILLAGAGAAVVVAGFRQRWLRAIACAALLLASAQLALQAHRATGQFAAAQQNPYVYAHTSKDLARLVNRVLGVAATHGQPDKLVIKVMAPGGDYWPLPWYFRQFKNVGWYDRLPEDPWAPIVIASPHLGAALDEKSDKRWISAGYYELRPRVFLEMFVELELWKKYIATLPPPNDDE